MEEKTATVYCEKSQDGLKSDIVYKYIYIFSLSNKMLASRDLLGRKGPLLCLLLNPFIHITAWTIFGKLGNNGKARDEAWCDGKS